MNELQHSKTWYRRGKVYKAKTMEALKELHAPPAVKPGSEPKGIANAQKPRRAGKAAAAAKDKG